MSIFWGKVFSPYTYHLETAVLNMWVSITFGGSHIANSFILDTYIMIHNSKKITVIKL